MALEVLLSHVLFVPLALKMISDLLIQTDSSMFSQLHSWCLDLVSH